VSVLYFKTDRKYVALINCNKDKGGEILIRLAKAMPETSFLGVIGSYGEQVVEKGIPNLHYMKNTPNIRSFYSKIGIVLMPSIYESWGRVAVESMSLGIPVVANPTSGLRESLDSVGLFAKDDNLGQWIHAIRSLQTNPWLYERKSQEGRIRAAALAEKNKKQLVDVEKWLEGIQSQ
jgi:glycosyltransferase involved in cell wall biosynthesis